MSALFSGATERPIVLNRVVDAFELAVTQVLPDETVVFARVNGHPPLAFAKTFDATDPGPFKQIIAEHGIDHRVHTG